MGAARAARRLVLADNDPAALELILTDLRLEGHEIVGVAADGETALALCREHGPDVVVIDYRMPPGPNGLEVARTIVEELPGTEVVIYTNYERPDLVEQARLAGVTLLPKGNLRSLRRAVSG